MRALSSGCQPTNDMPLELESTWYIMRIRLVESGGGGAFHFSISLARGPFLSTRSPPCLGFFLEEYLTSSKLNRKTLDLPVFLLGSFFFCFASLQHSFWLPAVIASGQFPPSAVELVFVLASGPHRKTGS